MLRSPFESSLALVLGPFVIDNFTFLFPFVRAFVLLCECISFPDNVLPPQEKVLECAQQREEHIFLCVFFVVWAWGNHLANPPSSMCAPTTQKPTIVR